MCGIFGVWERSGERVDLSAVERSVHSMRHRGPDDEGYVLINTGSAQAQPCRGNDTPADIDLPHIREFAGEDFDLVLGHRRLAILDTSSAGHQPMTDGMNWIVHSGEIFNFEEIRPAVMHAEDRSISRTDTEVILAAHAREAGEIPSRTFDGMWAFAIFDMKRRSLLCSRDRFGMKPFHYRREQNRFIFSSEIKGICHYTGTPPVPDMESWADYLAWGMTDHTDRTFVQGVRSLAAAHTLTVQQDGERIDRYWSIDSPGSIRPSHEDAADSAKLHDLLRESTRRRFRSDVPVGTLLSGGLDSSSVTCLGRDILGSAPMLPAFTALFEQPELDERPYVDAAAQASNADVSFVLPGAEDLPDLLTSILLHQEGPVANSSVYAQWRVMELARQKGVTVALDGQGADELFSGYPQAGDLYLRRLLRAGRLGSLFTEAKHYAGRGKRGLLAGLVAAAAGRSPSRIRRPPDWLTRDAILDDASWRYPPEATLRQILENDVTYRLPSLLRYGERTSMSFGLEIRMPFLQNELASFAYELNDRQRIRNGAGKAILRQAMKGTVPDQILERRTKNAFLTPESAWLLGPNLPRIREMVLDGPLMQVPIVNTSVVTNRLDEAVNGEFRGPVNDLWRWLNTSVCLENLGELATS